MSEKVVVGMSGGVDSAVAAYLLKEAGYEVVALTLVTSPGESSRCCEIDDARKTARQLGIQYYAWNAGLYFREKVITPFVNDYVQGLTPNPCVECNRFVKWERLLFAAAVMGADYVATGHYAAVVPLDGGRYTIREGASRKDQSYMLYKLTQEQLQRTLLPLGNLTKEEVRSIAARLGLSIARKEDSQEICFVTQGHYADYVASHYDGELADSGNFVDEAGATLGKHRGIIHYTVGQRKGLGLALGYPAYVKGIDPRTGDVVIAGEEALYTQEIFCGDLNFMSCSDLTEGARATVKIRYHHPGEAATIEKIGGSVRVAFDRPVRAATPGQSAVFYDRDKQIIGGGRILSPTCNN